MEKKREGESWTDRQTDRHKSRRERKIEEGERESITLTNKWERRVKKIGLKNLREGVNIELE